MLFSSIHLGLLLGALSLATAGPTKLLPPVTNKTLSVRVKSHSGDLCPTSLPVEVVVNADADRVTVRQTNYGSLVYHPDYSAEEVRVGCNLKLEFDLPKKYQDRMQVFVMRAETRGRMGLQPGGQLNFTAGYQAPDQPYAEHTENYVGQLYGDMSHWVFDETMHWRRPGCPQPEDYNWGLTYESEMVLGGEGASTFTLGGHNYYGFDVTFDLFWVYC